MTERRIDWEEIPRSRIPELECALQRRIAWNARVAMIALATAIAAWGPMWLACCATALLLVVAGVEVFMNYQLDRRLCRRCGGDGWIYENETDEDFTACDSCGGDGVHG